MPIGDFNGLLLATAVFLLIHIVPSSALRGRITGAIGEGAYMGVYSLLSIAALVWMVLAFNASGPGAVLWYNPGPLQYLSVALMFVALILGVGGLIGNNPTSIGGRVAGNGDPATGFLRISRHPFLTSVVIWAVAHLIVRGDLRSIIFFGGFGVLAAVGTLLIDAKTSRRVGADWQRFAEATSIIPFLAILQGRNRLRLGELKLWRLGIGIAIFLAVLHFHAAIMGVYPLP